MSTLPPLQYHTLRHGNRQVSIELWPRPGAACLVFYPGTMFCPVQYRTFLRCLWKNGLAVAALHLTGHGINPHRCRFSFDDLLRDGLDAEQWLLDNGMGPLLLAGHSQGGILAMAHASRSGRMRACFAFSGIFPQSRRAIELTRFAPWAAQRERLLAGLKVFAPVCPGYLCRCSAICRSKRSLPVVFVFLLIAGKPGPATLWRTCIPCSAPRWRPRSTARSTFSTPSTTRCSPDL